MTDDAQHNAAGGDRRSGAPCERLIVFARYPEPGTTKKRLIPALGAEGAAELQHRMNRRVLAAARSLHERRGVGVEVRYAGGDRRRMAACFGGDLAYVPQQGDSLGERLRGAFAAAFEAGASRVVTIGSDCPGLTADRLAEAFEALRRSEVVLGPATDGGYYLIGLRRPVPGLFEGIDWGSERVLSQTLERADRLGLSVHQLEALADVDRPEDLEVWRRAEGGNGAGAIGEE